MYLCGAILMAGEKEASRARPNPTGHATLMYKCCRDIAAIHRVDQTDPVSDTSSLGGIKTYMYAFTIHSEKRPKEKRHERRDTGQETKRHHRNEYFEGGMIQIPINNSTLYENTHTQSSYYGCKYIYDISLTYTFPVAAFRMTSCPENSRDFWTKI